MPHTVTITVDPADREPLLSLLNTELDCIGDTLSGMSRNGEGYEGLPGLLARLELATNAHQAIRENPDAPVSIVVDPDWLRPELVRQAADLATEDFDTKAAQLVATGHILDATTAAAEALGHLTSTEVQDAYGQLGADRPTRKDVG